MFIQCPVTQTRSYHLGSSSWVYVRSGCLQGLGDDADRDGSTFRCPDYCWLQRHHPWRVIEFPTLSVGILTCPGLPGMAVRLFWGWCLQAWLSGSPKPSWISVVAVYILWCWFHLLLFNIESFWVFLKRIEWRYSLWMLLSSLRWGA